MAVETIPLILGAIVGLIGIGLLFDAWTPDDIIVKRERRRRQRVERSRAGETWIGLGVLGVAAAFIGRDTWKYSIVAVMAGMALMLLGTMLNWRYFSERVTNRGALRRRRAEEK